MSTTEQKSFIDSVKNTLTSRKVWVRCDVGTLPLEWPKDEKGRKCITDATLMPLGNKLVKVDEVVYRNIETRIVDERGVGAQSAGYMELDLLDESHPTETDAQFLARIKDWIANSNDPRIAAKNVRVEEGNPFPLPFQRWDDLKPETLLDMTANMLGDDHDANLDMLRRFAGYELSRTVEGKDGMLEPAARQAVLDGLEILARSAGDESDDDVVIADDSDES